MLSGAKARHAQIVAAFCAPGETLVGWLALGSATREVAPRDGKPAAAQVITPWAGLPGAP